MMTYIYMSMNTSMLISIELHFSLLCDTINGIRRDLIWDFLNKPEKDGRKKKIII